MQMLTYRGNAYKDEGEGIEKSEGIDKGEGRDKGEGGVGVRAGTRIGIKVMAEMKVGPQTYGENPPRRIEGKKCV